MTVIKPKLVSLLANWYSGATLLTILLNGHSRIVSNAEAMFFDDEDEHRYQCTCGKYIDECDYYQATARHMRLPNAAGWDKRTFVHVPRFSRNWVLHRLLRSSRFSSHLRDRCINAIPAYRRIRDRFLDAQLEFFANARRFAGAPIYMDGTKSIRRAQLFAGDDRSEMKVLHLIRDGRGFCVSCVNNLEDSEPTLTDAAKMWRRYIARVDRFSRAFPSVPVLVVRYEDLCRSTTETIRGICQFLEIPYEELNVGGMKGAHILGHRMSRNFDGTIVENTSWRETLDHDTQIKLTALMKRQLERFGYL
jgi:hypothetical protein